MRSRPLKGPLLIYHHHVITSSHVHASWKRLKKQNVSFCMIIYQKRAPWKWGWGGVGVKASFLANACFQRSQWKTVSMYISDILRCVQTAGSDIAALWMNLVPHCALLWQNLRNGAGQLHNTAVFFCCSWTRRGSEESKKVQRRKMMMTHSRHSIYVGVNLLRTIYRKI